MAITLQWLPSPVQLVWALEHLVKDRLILLNVSEQPEDRIVVIDIDEASLAAIAPWPWKRSTVADLVETLVSDYRVRGIGLDVVFPAQADALGDQRLAALAQNAPLTLAQAFDFVPRQPAIQTGQPVLQALPATTQAMASQLTTPPMATGYIANHAGLRDARCVGNIGIRPDADGQVRSVPLFAQWQQGYSPLLPLAMLQCGQGNLKVAEGWGFAVALIPASPWEVPYSRSWNAYTVIAAQDILQRTVDPETLRNRWVLVGSSALG